MAQTTTYSASSDRTPEAGQSAPLLILIPGFNDWDPLRLLLEQLDGALDEHCLEAEVLIVDDASTVPMGDTLSGSHKTLRRVRVLPLLRNLGHQRAITIGLAWIHEHASPETVVVMDGDGEDDPRDVQRLVDLCRTGGGKRIVFAQRERRSEDLAFRAGYVAYKILHRVLTGRRVEVGNFSAIPAAVLPRLVVISETWNHYAAAVMKAELPHDMLPTRRAKRLAGKSHMNVVSLVTHGLSAISVFADTVGVRLLIATMGLILLTSLAGVAVLAARFGAADSVPTWATPAIALICLILLQSVMAAVVVVFITLSGRQGSSFIPLRDYTWFCSDPKQVYPAK